MPAQTTGTLTEPTVALTVPFAEIARLQTGKRISREILDVAHAGVDDEPEHAARLERRREQVAEHAVGVRRADGDDHDVAGLRELDGDVQHPVVAGMQQHRDRAAADARARIDRPHVRLEQSRAALRLVHGSDSVLAQGLHDAGVGAIDVADCDVVDHPLLSCHSRKIRRLY